MGGCGRASGTMSACQDSPGITVEAAEGPRSELALELISSGDALVRFGGVEIW
jgi:hypothetical protein